ncbi:MAG TPA: hypothetical protein VHV77_16620, partial [Pirellulales bacterium]|nr:hypothetical protein [Pirellulales bacterium]
MKRNYILTGLILALFGAMSAIAEPKKATEPKKANETKNEKANAKDNDKKNEAASKKSSKGKTKNISGFTKEREAAALTFVRTHHAELAELLEQLKA